jgi:hypothetical protein
MFLAAAAVTLLAACGNQSIDHGGMTTQQMAGPQSSKAVLAPAAAAGTGTATMAVVKGQIHVDVRTAQLSPSGAYTVHLHQGSCDAIGSIIRPLGDIQTDASGSGMLHLEYAGTEVPAPAFIDAHAPGSTEGPAICGDLKANP